MWTLPHRRRLTPDLLPIPLVSSTAVGQPRIVMNKLAAVAPALAMRKLPRFLVALALAAAMCGCI